MTRRALLGSGLGTMLFISACKAAMAEDGNRLPDEKQEQPHTGGDTDQAVASSEGGDERPDDVKSGDGAGDGAKATNASQVAHFASDLAKEMAAAAAPASAPPATALREGTGAAILGAPPVVPDPADSEPAKAPAKAPEKAAEKAPPLQTDLLAGHFGKKAPVSSSLDNLASAIRSGQAPAPAAPAPAASPVSPPVKQPVAVANSGVLVPAAAGGAHSATPAKHSSKSSARRSHSAKGSRKKGSHHHTEHVAKSHTPRQKGVWHEGYTPSALRLDYPTLDPYLLGLMAGEGKPVSSRGRTAPRPIPRGDPLARGATPELGDGIVGGSKKKCKQLDCPVCGGRFDEVKLNPGDKCPVCKIGVPVVVPIALAPEYAEFAGDRCTTPEPLVEPPAPTDPLYLDLERFKGLAWKTLPQRGYVGDEFQYIPMQFQVAAPDRWRGIGWPDYAIHNRGGGWFDPYNQNILKGDFPIYGDRTFMVLGLVSNTVYEERHIPTPAQAPAARPGEFDLFQNPMVHAFRQDIAPSVQIFYGDTAFEPPLFNFKFTSVLNVDNTVRLAEVGILTPDVRDGASRSRGTVAIQDLFVEARIDVLSPYFDFVSLRVGRQPFISDFRGFVLDEQNNAVRLFGNGGANRTQYNLMMFHQKEHDTNTGLLRGENNDRGQRIAVANVFRQDFLGIPGFTGELVYHYNRDDPDFKFDQNGFLVRPDPVGSIQPHQVRAHYLGFANDGHIGALNLSSAFYQVYGRDSYNNLAGHAITIDAQMAAVEASVDHDWIRYKASFFYASGDRDPLDFKGRGFDTIIDKPNFAGGEFSYWNREGIRIFGVGLKQELSLVPNLRSSKLQGQSNFVNPGLLLYNAGLDMEVTPHLKLVLNTSLVRFAETQPLELFLFDSDIPKGVGLDYGLGAIYRPDLNQNIIFKAGILGFRPGDGFAKIFDGRDGNLYAAFTQMILAF